MYPLRTGAKQFLGLQDREDGTGKEDGTGIASRTEFRPRAAN